MPRRALWFCLGAIVGVSTATVTEWATGNLFRFHDRRA